MTVILSPDRLHEFNPDILAGIYASGQELGSYERLVSINDRPRGGKA